MGTVKGRTLATLTTLMLFVSLCSGAFAQSTGQLLISSGFNPVAAITPEMTRQLMALPSKQFVMRHKGICPYYVYADASGCSCVYVGSETAMRSYRDSFHALPAEALNSAAFTDPEQNLIESMDNDEAGAQFNTDVFGSGF